MCLVTYQKYPKIALRNIKVKKVVWYFKGSWKTPIQLMPLDPDNPIIKPTEKQTFWELIKGKHRGQIRIKSPNRLFRKKGLVYSFNMGFIHSLGLSRNWGCSEDKDKNERIVVLNAVIPIGSFYYHDKENDEYCSTKLKIKWEID